MIFLFVTDIGYGIFYLLVLILHCCSFFNSISSLAAYSLFLAISHPSLAVFSLLPIWSFLAYRYLLTLSYKPNMEQEKNWKFLSFVMVWWAEGMWVLVPNLRWCWWIKCSCSCLCVDIMLQVKDTLLISNRKKTRLIYCTIST